MGGAISESRLALLGEASPHRGDRHVGQSPSPRPPIVVVVRARHLLFPSGHPRLVPLSRRCRSAEKSAIEYTG
jgi:hypothetical protein